MKATTLTVIACAAALSACASAGATAPGFAASDTSFTGWEKFTGEEFELDADQDQVLQPFSRPCVSGAASRDELTYGTEPCAPRSVGLGAIAQPETVQAMTVSAARYREDGSVDMRASRDQPCRLKYCTSRSCCSACARVSKVPRLRRRPVFGSTLRE